MTTRRCRATTALAALAALAWPGRAGAADGRLAAEARGFLAKYCYDCHGGAHDVGEDLNVADRESLLKYPCLSRAA